MNTEKDLNKLRLLIRNEKEKRNLSYKGLNILTDIPEQTLNRWLNRDFSPTLFLFLKTIGPLGFEMVIRRRQKSNDAETDVVRLDI